MQINYILSCKTMNTRENLWDVNCFATNQMRDETAKDNRQTVALVSYDLMQDNELAFSTTGQRSGNMADMFVNVLKFCLIFR